MTVEHEMVTAPETNGDDSATFLEPILREPLAQFLALSSILFVAQAIFADNEREAVLVDDTTQTYLIEHDKGYTPGPLTKKEKRQAIKIYIEEETLVRETIKRGSIESSHVYALPLQSTHSFISAHLPEPSEDTSATLSGPHCRDGLLSKIIRIGFRHPC